MRDGDNVHLYPGIPPYPLNDRLDCRHDLQVIQCFSRQEQELCKCDSKPDDFSGTRTSTSPLVSPLSMTKLLVFANLSRTIISSIRILANSTDSSDCAELRISIFRPRTPYIRWEGEFKKASTAHAKLQLFRRQHSVQNRRNTSPTSKEMPGIQSSTRPIKCLSASSPIVVGLLVVCRSSAFRNVTKLETTRGTHHYG